jgi:hypothetical protein
VVVTNAAILGQDSRGTHGHIVQSQIRYSPNLKGHSPVFVSPRNRMTQLYLQYQKRTSQKTHHILRNVARSVMCGSDTKCHCLNCTSHSHSHSHSNSHSLGSLFVHQRNCVLRLLYTCIIHTYSYITCFGYLVAIFRCASIQ